MDQFGIASGLVAIDTRRPDNSFLEFVRRDNPNNPLYSGFSKANGLPVDVPGLTDRVTDVRAASDRIFKNIQAWTAPVPAPVDITSLNWSSERFHGNWDGNQGVTSGTLASGASETGDPRMVNVRIHEPMNPFIDNLPPPPYPFRSVDLTRAREGKALFKANCATCHAPRNQTIYSTSALGVDPNRTMAITSVSRFGLTALVTEACYIYGLNNKNHPGANWCVPARRLASEAERLLPRHPPARGGRYQRIQGRRTARHLGAGTLPAQRIGSHARAPRVRSHASTSVPAGKRALRRSAGRLRMVGETQGALRTRRHDADQEYDSTVPGNANTGHTFRGRSVPRYQRARSRGRSAGDHDADTRIESRIAA